MTTPFIGELTTECATCGGALVETDDPIPFYRWTHADKEANHHHLAARGHRCATCKGQPYHAQEAYGDVIGCHACRTRTFHSIGD
ncbi:hypothetical protein [Nocardia wallacei]|uniref:hypothetical protein n=1 Tax=Nocardia wallacei TaxID=480035 RepID=UPI0024552EF8|nr:hypothetical protein [Nocardia wallacei]